MQELNCSRTADTVQSSDDTTFISDPGGAGVVEPDAERGEEFPDHHFTG